MDRNRETRRVTMAATNGGLSRRRHRGSSLRDSPEEDGVVELQETAARLRDRGGSGKKDRDRERDRERDRDRDRDRLSRSKRRRAERLMHGSNRDDGGGGDDTSEESVNDDEEDEDDDGGGGGGIASVGGGGGGGGASSMRMLPPNPTSLSSSSLSNHHHRKSFPPPAKVFRATPTTTTTTTWKAGDEMIGVSVPRKARSASTKRALLDSWVSSSGEQIHQQASTSPVRPMVAAAILASPAPSPVPAPPSPPSSSNASVRKKMKPNGPKQRPPKSSSKSTSSAQDEIEIEIAEVLYGMRQPQDPSKQEIMGNDSSSIKFDSRDTNNNNKSSSDAKSRVSSPISNSPSTLLPQSSSILPTNSSSSASPMSAIAPKRKRPRQVKYEDENPSIFTARNSLISKVEIDQPAKAETCSPNLDKNSGSASENGSISYDLMNSHGAPPRPPSSEPRMELVKPETNLLSDSKALTEEMESRDGGGVTKEEVQSPKKESPSRLRLDTDRDNLTVTKGNSVVSEIESQREEKFQIDLMAPPPLRSSPERDGEIGFVAVDPKAIATDVEMEMKPMVKENEKVVKIGKEDLKVNVNVNVVAEEKKAKSVHEETETQKATGIRERNIDLQFDLEKSDRDSGTGSVTGNKLNHHFQKLQQQQPNTEKAAQPNSLSLPMSMASWPGGLPPMGYMAPLQGVVSMDGSTVSSAAIQQPPHLLFNQPRPKRCATHCYIARNIHYHQQFTRMNPFWPAAPGSGSLYGPKVGNLNVVPPTDLHGNIPVRNVNSIQDKGQGLAIYPGHTGKDKGSQAANMVDAQRKQILLQQALPPGTPSNILHAPAFIFPLSQQQAAAASVRPGSVKSPPAAGGAASSSASSSASISATATAAAAATAMGFNYPNMPGNETQYLAILQNNPYSFLPPHVGAAPAYRGTHAQAMPIFNGPFYPSQMLHPSQLQQQQPPPPPPTQSQQSQQGHQNTSISSGSSSSQKHLQNQQQRSHGSGINGGSGSLQGFPGPKNQSSQPLQLPQRQHQQQGQHAPHQTRQLESEMGGEDSPSTADSRVSRAPMSIYGQNFAMSMQPSNFALVATPASMGGATSTSGNHTEKKPQQQQPQQQGGSKAGVETLPQAFAMSFTSINGATGAPGLDISSIAAQNHAILQSFSETRHGGYQIMAAQAAQQKKNFRVSEEGKSGGNDVSNVEEERKAIAGKLPSNVGQSIAFSRPDLTETSVSSIPGNTVIDSSARTLNLSSAPPRSSGSVMPAAISTVISPNAQQQAQRNQQQQQQQQQHNMMQLQKQLQMSATVRNKTPATSNGSIYTDQHLSSSMAAKYPNALSAFPQNLVQSSSSPVQPPQWKNSVRTTTSQVSSPSLASSTSSSLKNLPQQQGRTQQSHTQISFATNPKTSTAPQGQQAPNSNQSQSPGMVVSSPTTSISKGAGGSPRTTASTSSGNKGGQASTLSSQQSKNSPSVPSRKSSPVGGRNVSSSLGNPHVTSSSSTGNKTQLPQQQQQQQQQQQYTKHALQQAQLFFSNPAYMQPQAQHSASTTSSATAGGGYYIQRHRSEQQQPQQQPPVSSATSSSGMLSLNTSTTDPARAVAAATSNMKGGGLPPQGMINVQYAAAQSSGKSHQLVPGFPYVHAVQVKQTEQKQPAVE